MKMGRIVRMQIADKNKRIWREPNYFALSYQNKLLKQ